MHKNEAYRSIVSGAAAVKRKKDVSIFRLVESRGILFSFEPRNFELARCMY